jgi:archaellum component FlaC
MTMSTDWKATKANTVRRLSAAGASVQFTRNFIAGFSAGLSKQLDAFEAASTLAGMQKAATKATATIRVYVATITAERKKVSGAVEKVCEDTANVLNWLEDRITKRVANARTAANSASMTLGSMHVYWKTSKKSIEAQVKRAGNAVDIDGMKKTLSEFDSGLGKELDAFEAAYPDVARMRQSNERIRQIVKRYKITVAKTEKKAGEDRVSARLAAELQTSLNDVFDGIEERINALLDDLVTSANNAFWSVSAVNR